MPRAGKIMGGRKRSFDFGLVSCNAGQKYPVRREGSGKVINFYPITLDCTAGCHCCFVVFP